MNDETYLGDGLYASFDEAGAIVLRNPRSDGDLYTVLDGEVFLALLQFAARHEPAWVMSPQDSAAFVGAIIDPPQPNSALVAAAERYKKSRGPVTDEPTKPAVPGISPNWRAVKPMGCEADDPDLGSYWSIRSGPGYRTAAGTGFEMTGFCSDAEARLMAAAPKLLAACQQARTLLINDLIEPGRTVFWTLIDAIKATEAPPTEDAPEPPAMIDASGGIEF